MFVCLKFFLKSFNLSSRIFYFTYYMVLVGSSQLRFLSSNLEVIVSQVQQYSDFCGTLVWLITSFL